MKIGHIHIGNCICSMNRCDKCVQWVLGGCAKCYRPAHSQLECEKCKKEK